MNARQIMLDCLRANGACREGMAEAARYDSLSDAWQACTRPDWMLWLAYKTGHLTEARLIDYTASYLYDAGTTWEECFPGDSALTRVAEVAMDLLRLRPVSGIRLAETVALLKSREVAVEHAPDSVKAAYAAADSMLNSLIQKERFLLYQLEVVTSTNVGRSAQGTYDNQYRADEIRRELGNPFTGCY